MSLRRRALFFAGLFVAVSCSDAGNPLAPPRDPEPGPSQPVEAMQVLQCSVNVANRTMQCGPEQPQGGGSLASGPLITGGQNVYVTLANTTPVRTGAPADAVRDTLTMNVTVQNLIPQALGTVDGTTPHSQGVRVFFSQEPVGIPNGDAFIANASGDSAITSVLPQPYYQYNGLLEPSEVSEAKPWVFAFDETVTSFNFKVYVWAMVRYYNGWADITPKGDTIAPAETTALSAAVRRKNGTTIPGHQSVTWSSSDEGVATVDGSGLVTGVSAGTAQITATPNPPYEATSVTIVVNSPVQAVTDSVDALGNVTISYPASVGLLANDTDADGGQTLSVVPGTVATAEGGTAQVAANGSFTYLSFPGFIGKDTIPYTVTDGVEEDEGVAIVNVGQRYWYVQPSAASSGNGTDASPFNTLAAAGPASSGTDVILVLGGGNPAASDAGITLDNSQQLIGQGIAADLTTTLMGGVVSVTLLDGTGVSPKVAGTVTVGQNNTIRGVQIDAASGAAIAGTGFGTLAISEQVILNPSAGPALNLTNGALNSADVFSLSSTGSTSTGLSLTNVTGSLTANGGAISGTAAGSAAIVVSGGSVSLTYGGSVTKANAGSLLSVTSSHTGTLAFNGALSATAGDGLQFNAAGGTYNFNGTTTLNGGDAGVDITNGSAGTFSFATGTGITSPTGTAFTVYGSSPTVTYSGNITKGNAGLLVDIGEQPGGSVTFNTGTLQATAGDGISLSNADGTNSFNGTTTLNGGNAGVDVVSQSSGAISFGSGASIGNASGNALHVANGGASTNVTFAGGITSSATGLAAHVEGVSAGSVTASGSISGANGIVVQNNTGGTITFSGAKTLNTGAGAGVTLSNNPGTAINLTGGALSITTSTGASILGNGAGGFGSLTVGNATVNATSGPALNLTNGTLNATFSSLTSTNSATNGVTLTTVSGTLNTSGGSISGAAGTAFNVSGGNVGGTIATSITQNNNASTLAVAGGHNTGTLTFSAAVSAGNGNGLQFTDADGTYTFTGNFSLNGAGDEGIDLLAASTGTVNVTPSGGNTASIVSPSGIAISIAGGSLNYSGDVTQASNAALLSVTGGHTGTVTFPSGTLNASNGTGLQFDNADGTYSFSGTVTLAGGDAGIDVTNGSGGTFTFPTAANITSPSTGNLISILNSAPNFTYSGGLTKANNNVTGILISNNTGGSITFNGDATSADGDPADVARTIQSGTAAAVSLVSNGSASILFSGGGLNITTSSGTGFNATGGGTVQVTGAGNQVNANGGGTAVNVQNTTIGGGGMSFFRVDATGAGTNGIVLSNTGAGGFQVTGDGASDPANTTRGRTTAGSGGPIVLGSGGTISGRSGHGVSLATTGQVILRNMLIQGSGSSGDGINASSTGRMTIDNMRITGHASDHGILGNTVSGLALHHSEVDNNGTTVGVVEGPDIWNIRFLGLTGTDSIRNSNIHHSQENVLGIVNTSGVLNLTVLNTNITDTGAGAGGTTALMVAANGSSNVTLNVQSVNIERGRSRGIQIGTEAASSAVLNLTVNNSQFLQNGAAIDVSHGSSGTNTFSITNNNLQAGVNSLQAIIVNRAASPSFNSFGLFTGTVSGNTIGTAGTANSGSDTSNGIEVESNGSGGITRVAVVNNTIREVGLHGIYVAAVDANLGGSTQPLLEARVASNTISNMDALGLDGIHVLPGALNTDDLTMCVDIANNNSTGVRNGLRVRPSGLPAAPSTVQLEGWDGVTAVNTYFTSRPNTLAGGVAAISTTAPPAPGGFVAVANCNTP